MSLAISKAPGVQIPKRSISDWAFGPGLTATLVSPALTTDELSWVLQNARPRVIVTARACWPAMERALDKQDDRAFFGSIKIFTVDTDGDVYPLVSSGAAAESPVGHDWKHLLCPPGPLRFSTSLLPAEAWLNRTALILWSSGTSGRSKGVLLSHHSINSSLASLWIHSDQYSGRQEKWLGFVPFYHIFGFVAIFMLSICTGSAVYLMPSFSLDAMLAAIPKHKITYLYMAPPIAVMLAKSMAVEPYARKNDKGENSFASVSAGFTGGAPLGHEIIVQVYKRLGFRIRIGYGMSEAGSIASQHGLTERDMHFQAGTSGQPLAGVELMIASDQNDFQGGQTKPALTNTPGEILIRSGALMSSYLPLGGLSPGAKVDMAPTLEALTPDGWLRTGDVGTLDAGGHLRITDRIKELIKVQAYQVAPAELEALLCSHSAVADTGVIGVYDQSEATEWPRAFVVVRDRTQTEHQLRALSEELKQLVEAKTVKYKWLIGGIVFVEQIPKSPSGKILRRVLRDEQVPGLETRAKGLARLGAMLELGPIFGLMANILPVLTPIVVLAGVEHLFLPQAGQKLSVSLASPALVFTLAWAWLSFVTVHVPEPYLDEIFHVPQAQTYCRGRFLEWDDKITTPPGLYLLSILAMKVRLLFVGDPCSAFMLRSFNVWSIAVVALLASLCRRRIEASLARKENRGSISSYSIHTGLNIALFPLVFFFSGLYYTDVLSTVSILAAYAHHLDRINSSSSSLISDFVAILLGIAALFMRQTNIFWVVVYMGGLETVHAVKQSKTPTDAKMVPQSTLSGRVNSALQKYSRGKIHDPPISSCWPDDIIFSLFSISVAVLCNPLRVLRRVWPHITIMALFGGFVAWNGGVVLGDKSNHVATIHLAQMLYIWPLFALFSVPLFIPSLMSGLNTLIDLPSQLRALFTTKECNRGIEGSSGGGGEEASGLKWARLFFTYRIYYFPYIAATFILSALVVKLNTIVHPFTLADNRHYMFYIFRYTIRSHPVLIASSSTGKNERKPSPPGGRSSVTALDVDSTPCIPTTASTVAILFLATSLSLITAPLVEPRYFIIPWVMWRLLVPAWAMQDLSSTPLSFVTKLPLISGMVRFGNRYDVRLFIETAWFLAVNAATMYIFIAKAYTWRAEDGTILDGGRLQHFMW
ncbi:Dol-P-Glc:Glc(2)Man(9)GlcNAc(2)-PP-Dol alpha-1 2-glucosyltransferase [Ceratocystis platani]|uniref:Dol-P-Glc:Glc(2)Man(9)GlcNAc(2)-PP-Dol alpha-1,2-glucosyltransferase n=1 Tax=Ceratocystis fimbriata f. sp. platani TaxID=88771 RepID=A0A0F8BLT8_CERFI|nr:Dol-P-Glc:Glc(2)Man(9)GlcNAc(2)-PP-Dol alpha-1 2-glucosyltransferase [Ceratocystis platani]